MQLLLHDGVKQYQGTRRLGSERDLSGPVWCRAKIAEEVARVTSMRESCQKLIGEVNEEKEQVSETMRKAMEREAEAKEILEKALARERAAEELEQNMKAVLNERMTEKERVTVEERSIEERRAELDRIDLELKARQEAMAAELQLESDRHAERDAQLRSQVCF